MDHNIGEISACETILLYYKSSHSIFKKSLVMMLKVSVMVMVMMMNLIRVVMVILTEAIIAKVFMGITRIMTTTTAEEEQDALTLLVLHYGCLILHTARCRNAYQTTQQCISVYSSLAKVMMVTVMIMKKR